ncbi:hypothetical protein EV363DRAFT_1403322 [Boletus edulis]|nr:hypothetical protein EV363DRAFT_1403322 [Boletus edulis]
MIDTGSTGNFVSPACAKITEMNIFSLEQQLTLQLGCIGSRSKITHGGKTCIVIGRKTSEIYFDVANIDQYDCILGIPFLREQQAVLNFLNQMIQIGNDRIALLEEGEVNHRILLIEEGKHYTYHLPCCTDMLKQQLSDKI